MHNNVGLISESYEDYSNGNTVNSSISAIPLRFDDSSADTLQIICISKKIESFATFISRRYRQYYVYVP